MLEKFRISQGSLLHISQEGRGHIYYDSSIEIIATREALKAFYEKMFENDKQSICNCDNCLGGKCNGK